MEDLIALRKKILELVETYAEESLIPSNFVPGQDPVSVSGKVLSPADFRSIVDSTLDGWFTSGRFTSNFEKKLSNFIGARSSVFVNSGSSANLLAITSLTSPKLGKKALKEGDEVVTAAMGFPTTINPIIQNKLIPVFVDVDIKTFSPIVDQVREAISKKTKAIFFAHALGNPFEVDEIKKICDEYDLWLIEDNCDALGSRYKSKLTGSFGDIATQSFYPAHHITTGEGGAVVVQSPLIRKLVESFRDWGRDCYCETGKDDTCAKRFGWTLGELPRGYDHKYIYSHIGYNLKATEMQAALGLSQIDKLPKFIQSRKDNFNLLKSILGNQEELILAEPTSHSDPSWFGFPFTIKNTSKINRSDLIKFLDNRKIATRLLFAGNILRQPGYLSIKSRQVSSLQNSNVILENSLWVGVHPGLTEEMIRYTGESILEFLKASR